MKICVVGSGYVGLSLSILLSQKHEVSLLDTSIQKINQVNNKTSPIRDTEIEKYLKEKKLNLNATILKEEAYNNAEFIIIATPTNYDENTSSFDTSSVEEVIKDIVGINLDASIVIKSTVPFGFTERMKQKFKKEDIFFSPEFLRENHALQDNLFPSRVVIGDANNKSRLFGEILIDCSKIENKDISFLTMSSKEAEASKLFANSFLAMRVAFFNELDTFCEVNDLNSKKIIKSVSLDPRIGDYYNNPSFGYGGYCLPKDTKQLIKNFHNIPNELISAVVSSNQTRKKFIAQSIINKNPSSVGVYRLIMKNGSDNIRESAVIDVLEILRLNNIAIIIYEPIISKSDFNGFEVESNLDKFFEKSDLIIANRDSEDLTQVKNKVYSRDLFNEG